MIFLTNQITSTQSGEFSLIAKEAVKIPSDYHIQIDVKLASRKLKVKESHFSPPPFPALLQFLYLYV